MKILLICAAGMSTSLLVNNMKKFAKEGDIIEAHPASTLDGIVDKYDVVLVGPQIRYKYAQIESVCNAKGKAVGLMDMVAYGQMNGELAMEQARNLLAK